MEFRQDKTSKGDEEGTGDVKEIQENLSLYPKDKRVLYRKEQAKVSNSAESLNNMRMDMWPMALTHGDCYDIIKSRVQSEVERFQVNGERIRN